MSVSHLLEDFGATIGGKTVSMSDVTLEEERLDSYETGYKAGWDDAVKAQEGDSRRISGDFAQNLEDLEFTVTEATQGILRDLRPLLEEMVHKVLPKLARDSLGMRVTELLATAAADGMEPTIEITTSPANLASLEALVDAAGNPRVTLRSEDTLGEGQVQLRLGEEEREIDLDALLGELQREVSEFFDAQQSGPAPSFMEKETA